MKKKSKKDQEIENQLKTLSGVFENRGISIRREKLSRGSAFRVKSGNCLLSGDKVIFIDRRMPIDQQLSVMFDYIVELKIQPTEEELENLPTKIKDVLELQIADREAIAANA